MTRSFNLITTTAEFAAIRQEWNLLLSHSGIHSPFLRWEWQYQWWKTYGEPSAERQLAIIIAKEGNRIIGILPGYIRIAKQIYQKNTVYYFLGSEYESTDYLDIICAPESPPAELCKELFSVALNRFPELDLIVGMNLLSSAPFLKHLEQFAKNLNSMFLTQHHRICPYITPAENWESYLTRRGKNLRSNLKRKTRHLFEKHGVTFQVLTDPEDTDAAMSHLFRLHDLRFMQRREESKFVKPIRKGFHYALSKQFAESGLLRIFQLRKESLVLATLYCFLYNDELFYFQAGMDPEWHKYSVGMVLMGKVIKYVHEEGYKRFDFMRGSEAYKFKWTEQTRDMSNILIATSMRGKRIIRYKKTYELTKKSIRHMLPGR